MAKKSLSDAVHEFGGRIVADEALAQFEGDMAGAGGAGREDIEHFLSVFDSAACRKYGGFRPRLATIDKPDGLAESLTVAANDEAISI